MKFDKRKITDIIFQLLIIALLLSVIGFVGYKFNSNSAYDIKELGEVLIFIQSGILFILAYPLWLEWISQSIWYIKILKLFIVFSACFMACELAMELVDLITGRPWTICKNVAW